MADGYLRWAHVVVGTPQLLAAAVARGSEGAELMQHCKVVAVDEVDMCFQVDWFFCVGSAPFFSALSVAGVGKGWSKG